MTCDEHRKNLQDPADESALKDALDHLRGCTACKELVPNKIIPGPPSAEPPPSGSSPSH